MNKGLIIGGIASLILAGVMAVLILTLPADNLMFMVGERNMPWVAAAVFAVAGVVLLGSAGIGSRRAGTQSSPAQIVLDPEKAALNKRLETIAWGFFLIMFGGQMLVPDSVVAQGFWSIGVGAIMLGLNAARYVKGLRMSGFTTFLGIIAVAGGILQLLGWEEISGAFLLIVLGAFLLVKPWFDKRNLFGKAEQA